MMQDGNWATELEILALAHMLSVDIFTYSENRWIKFSGQHICSSMQLKFGGLYLNHVDENHYDVVLDVAESPVDDESNLERVSDSTNCDKGKCAYKRENILHYKREMYRRKYEDNPEFRNEKLEKASLRYKSDAQFRNSSKKNNRVRYQTDALYRDLKKLKGRVIYKEHANKERMLRQAKQKYRNDTEYRENIKRKGIEKYKTNSVHRSNCKKKSVKKYKTDEVHRNSVKARSMQKYRMDEANRNNVKTRSMLKYKMNEKHRETVKKRSIDKNALDDTHKKKVKKAGLLKYHIDEMFREQILCTRSALYKNDELFRSKIKDTSKQSYHTSPNVKRKKKENVKQRRLYKKRKLENEEEVVNLFKRNTIRGPEYVCCCCHRLLFENQVQVCDKNSYARNETAANVANVCIKDTFFHHCTALCVENCTKSSLWICFTCHRKILRGDIPPESAENNMQIEPVPQELQCLNSLEQHLISLHIPFYEGYGFAKGWTEKYTWPSCVCPV